MDQPVFATKLSDDDIDNMKMGIIGMGANSQEVADILQKYGPDVLSTVTEALRNGFSIPFIVETFRLLGPYVLDFMISVVSKNRMVATLTEQQQVGFGNVEKDLIESMIRDSEVDRMSASLLKVVVEKLIPYIFNKYGPQILQAILESVEKAIDEGTSK